MNKKNTLISVVAVIVIIFALGFFETIRPQKKAEAYLSSQTAQYEEARSKKQEAYQDMISLEEELTKVEGEYQNARTDQERLALLPRLAQTREYYNKAKDTYDNYQYTIAQYEDNLQKFHEEKYNEMSTTTWEYTKTLEDATDKEKKIREDNLKQAEYDYEWNKKMFEETGNEMYKTQMDNAKRIVDSQRDELNQYVSAITSKQGEVTQAGSNFIQGLANGMDSKKSWLFSTVSNIGNTMLSRLKASLKEQSPSKATREMGQFLLEGLSKGIKDDENALLNQVDELGNSVLGTLYADTQNAMNGLGGLMSTSLNPSINPSIAYDLNYKLMANAMKEALQEVDVELDDRKVGKFVNKVVSEEVFN